MIEEIVKNYLKKNLVVPAYLEEPEKAPISFVLVEKTGSSRENRIDSATIAIQSYGNRLIDAADLNESVKSVMDNIIELDEVSKCELNSDYNYTDVERKRYRYQAVFDITYYR